MDDLGPDSVTDERLEDCLRALHYLAAQGRPPAAAALAALARLPEGAVSAVLTELARRGLLTGAADGAPSLTPDGCRLADTIVRRHRLSERLFTDVLGLSHERAHEEAMRLEHALSPEAEARLATLLRHPAACPHGAPIPAAESRAAAPPTRPLDRIAPGTRVRIVRVGEEEAGLLRHLASLGLLAQSEITVEGAAPFGGPLLVRVGGSQYAISREIAARILVE